MEGGADLVHRSTPDHLGHRDTQIALARERGGRWPDPRRDYPFAGKGGRDWIRLSLDIEGVALNAYAALISRMRSCPKVQAVRLQAVLNCNKLIQFEI